MADGGNVVATIKSLKHNKFSQALRMYEWCVISRLFEDSDENSEPDDADDLRGWLTSLGATDVQLHQVDGWSWIDGGKVVNTWTRQTKEWAKLAGQKELSHKSLSRRWDQELTQQFGNVVGKEFGRELPRSGLKSGYGELSSRAQRIIQLILGDRSGTPSRIQVIDKVLHSHSTHPGPLILLSEVGRFCWLERNRLLFDNKRILHPDGEIAQSVRETVQIVALRSRGERG
ncbi:hypothetical protein R1sor_008939 [Riccia sorocarpa]|uniref:Uncharacterized protein n=1 Tax=Riccia sorocarpa TaxID=122646 RepID=A0ABD3H7M1_9MARC